jgi:TonB-dependent starch-binding outer membrane protein SusC
MGTLLSLFMITGMLLMPATVTGQNGNLERKALPDRDIISDLFQGVEINRDVSRSVVLNKMVSVRIQDAAVLDGLQEIADQAGLELIYNAVGIESIDHRLDLDLEHVTVNSALWEVLQGTGFRFAVSSHGQLVIMNMNESEEIYEQYDIVQEIVTGRVVDAQTGEALPGVNIVIEGTTTGTTTNVDGEFELNVQGLDETLVFTYIGYETHILNIDGRTEINVTLSLDVISGDELVVVGYGVQRRSDITGSIASVNADQISSQNVTPVSIDQMLQGRAAGVHITQSSSEPGGGSRIRIRGATSLTAGNQPLYVIDGMPIDNSNVTPGPGAAGVSGSNQRNPLNSLNPNDIQDIQILKDASATAIYGSRGANGVIIITTKQGTRDAFEVGYDTYVGFQQVDRTLGMLTAQEYMSVLNGLRESRGEAPEFTPDEINQVGEGTNWQNEIFRNNAPMQSHQFNISGGTSDTRYYASVNYYDQEGLVQNSGITRYQGRVNLRRDETERFSYGINLSTALVEDNFTAEGTGTNEFAGVINAALNQDPTFPVFDIEGNFVDVTTSNLENPVAMTNLHDIARTNRTQGNIFTQFDFLDNLTARASFGSDRRTVRRDTYNPSFTRRGAADQGIANVGVNNSSNYVFEVTLNYIENFAGVHDVNLLAGVTYEEFTNDGLSGISRGFATDAFLTNSLQAGNAADNNASSFRNKNQLLSYLSRVNYSYDNKYLLTASFRIDGSSRFGTGNQYGYFPSFSFGWNLGQEDFLSSLDIFSDLRLRAGFGVTGNQAIGNYNSLLLYGLAGNAVLGGALQTAIAPAQIPNPNLRWERTEQYNFGLDVEFLGGRFRGAIDYFIQNTDDLLLNLPIPITSGFNSSLQNIGSVKNTGFEFELTTHNVIGANFNWTTSANFSHVRNEVTDIGGLPEIIQGGIGFAQQFSIIREGEPMNSYFGYIVDGVFQEGDDIANSNQPQAQPGELIYRDVNGDGQITSADRTIIGSPFPDFTFGIDNSFSYKNFDLNISIYGSYGNDVLNINVIEAENPIDFRRNRLAEPLLNRWTPDNPTNDHPSFVPPNVSYGGNVTTRAVQDASFIRLRNLMLRYNLPPTGLLRSASVYIAGTNLLTITGYDGFSPDVSSLGGGNIVVDNNAYPLARTITMGFNINF